VRAALTWLQVVCVFAGDITWSVLLCRLTTTFYPAAFNRQRNISDMNLRDKGGVTWMHYENQSALALSGFEFGRY
jgi:hypothetical protein